MYSPGPVVPRDPFRPGGADGLGLLPAVVPAVESVVGAVHSVLNIGTSPAINTEKTIAPELNAMAASGNLTAFAIMIARAGIRTAGFNQLWQPLVTSLQMQHPDWYQEALDMVSRSLQPGQHALWDFPESKQAIIGYAQANARSAPGGTMPPPPADRSVVASAGFGSPLMIAAVIGAFLVGPKLLKKGRR